MKRFFLAIRALFTWKRFFLFVGSVLGITGLILGGTFLVIHKEASPNIYSDTTALPHTETAIILGASTLRNGKLSPVLRDRVDSAILLYKARKIEKILVSGDNSTITHNEVNPVRNYLLANGIPDQDIFLDHAGFDTYSSMYRARDIFRVSSVVIVSQAFHLPRAVYLARHLGINAYGFTADNGHYLLKNYIREWFANVKAVINLTLERKPKYLGDTIPINVDKGGGL